jgi:hypothetical protein
MKKDNNDYIWCINKETGKARYLAPAFVANKDMMKWGGWSVWEAETPTNQMDNLRKRKPISQMPELQPQESDPDVEIEIIHELPPIETLPEKPDDELLHENAQLKAEIEKLKASINPELKKQKRKYTKKQTTKQK